VTDKQAVAIIAATLYVGQQITTDHKASMRTAVAEAKKLLADIEKV
jgi:hypothetical protein